MTGFDLFIGIDWSGAQGECHRGIQVAEAKIGTACPQLIAPPQAKGWSRADVMQYLLDHKTAGRRVLAGIDFAFCHPFEDEAGYFPNSGVDLGDAAALWQKVDDANHAQSYFYGGGIWGHDVLKAYYNAPKRKDGTGGRGAYFQSRRRQTEITAAAQGRSPSPTFNCVGPAGVGTGSLAGMRVLHAMKNQAVIWPIHHGQDAVSSKGGTLALAEIFPAFYFAMAGVKDRVKAEHPLDAVNTVLTYFQSASVDAIADHVPDHDDLDALVSAAALRHLHDPDCIFPIAQQDADTAQREGWIFGVASLKTTS